MNILITGGAGYIGSHIVKLLGETTQHNLYILDNLSTGNREAILYGQLIEMDLKNFDEVDRLFNSIKFDAVIHFAASIVVPESVSNPLKYYMNNTVNTTNLIQTCIKYGVDKFIFSSTAAVYGEPTDNIAISETYPTNPINPYGRSKLMSENVIIDTAIAHNFRYVILRYFNVAGASVDNKIGQSFPNATHLIKVSAQTALGKRDSINIFGDDYPTKDGSCIRDYIHIEDLASAHIESLNYLINGGNSNIFNCGYGDGYSVKEVLSTMKIVSNIDFKTALVGRRDGDPSMLIANNSKILKTLNWRPKYNDLNFICKTALEWERKI